MLQIHLFIFTLFLGVFKFALAEDSNGRLRSTAVQSIKEVAGASQAQMAVSLIQSKFFPDADGNPPVWKVVSDPNGSGKPRVEVTEFNPQRTLVNLASSWGNSDYVVDQSGLAAIRKTSSLTDASIEQDGFIGIPSFSKLTSAQVANYFGGDTSRFPASTNSVEKVPVTFKDLKTGTGELAILNIQVGSMNVGIPVPVSGGWYQEAYLKAANGEVGIKSLDSDGDHFGRSSGISGDTIIVGAHWEDSGQTTITNGTSASSDNSKPDSGAVYVYRRTGTRWTQEAYLKSPNPDQDDRFGVSSGISGNTVVVGARYEDSNQTTITNGTSASSDNSKPGSGAVYVFRRTGTRWAQEAYLKASNADSGDDFGWVVAISGDRIVVGAWLEDSNQTTITNSSSASSDNSAPDSGAAYVFSRTGTQWEQEAYLKAPNADGLDNFGSSVAISGDTIVVAAKYEDSAQMTITNGTTAGSDNSATDSGAAYVYRRTGTQWVQEAYLKAANAESFDTFGASALGVAISGDAIVIGSALEDGNQTTITNGTAASSDNSATDSGAAYVFKRIGTQWVQEAYLKASNANAGDSFGNYVSISGDTIGVSAHGEDSNQTTITNGPTSSSNNTLDGSGAAYVFRRKNNTWVQEAYLKAPNADSGDKFGQYPAISGDTLVVTAVLEDSNQTTITNGTTASSDNSAPSSGAVYVFRRREVASTPAISSVTPSTAFCPGNSIIIFGSGFMKDATVKVGDIPCLSKTTQGPNEIVCELPQQPNAIPGDLLDITVTNPNGVEDVLQDSFTCDGWYQEAYIKASNADGADRFGRAVSLSEDTLVVGAVIESSNQTTITNGSSASSNNSASQSGAAYVFKRTGATWSQEAYLKAANADAADRFGVTASISGNTIVVGARSEDSNQTVVTNGTTASSDNTATDSGAAYVFKRNGNTWVQEAYLKASNASSQTIAEFGWHTSISGDTLVVGSWCEDSSQTTITNGTTAGTDSNRGDSGAAYVFRRKDSTWDQEAYLKASNADAADNFGVNVNISGDTIVVGAWYEDSSQTTITNGTTASSDNSTSNSGAGYVYRRSGSVWAQEAYLKAPNAGQNDMFAYELAISGDTVIVGSSYEDSNQTTVTNGATASSDDSVTDSGAAFVFRRTGTIWAQEAYLKASNTEAGDRFGASLSISGDAAVISAPRESSGQTTITNGPGASSDNSQLASGAAYVFRRTGNTWVQEAYLKASNAERGLVGTVEPDPSRGDILRYPSISGDTIAVGALWEDSSQTTITNGQTASADNSAPDSGAVYVFRRPERSATPDIISVTPTQAFCPGGNINIFGSGFMKDAIASVDGVDCSSTTVQGPNEIICTTPRVPSTEGTALTIRVTNPNGRMDTFLDTSDWVRTTSVNATNSDWIPSGITVAKGQSLQVTATGVVSDGAYTNISPSGVPNSASTGTCRVSGTSFNGSALLGKIGKSGAPFLIGSSFSTGSADASGELYLIHNDSNCASDNSGSFSVTITAPKAFNCDLPEVPVISINQQPEDQSTSNGSATFSVSAYATGGATLQYQWQVSTDGGTIFNNISGQTSSSLALSGLTTPQNNNKYRVVLNSSSVQVPSLGSVKASEVTSDMAGLYITVAGAPPAPGWSPMAALPSGYYTGASQPSVWTGEKLLIWGWRLLTNIQVQSNRGHVYSPLLNTWSPMSEVGSPLSRTNHSLVWTGSKMIVWGGAHTTSSNLTMFTGATGYPLNDGGIYDPETDTWRTVGTSNAPTARFNHVAVWTGTKMLVWGGTTNWGNFYSDTKTGGLYDPLTDTWTAMSTVNAPSERLFPQVAWTGSELIVWGGCRVYSLWATDCRGDGAIYNPTTNSWRTISPVNAPSIRDGSRGVWTGSQLIIWGGYINTMNLTGLSTTSGTTTMYNTGYAYDPLTNAWSVLPVDSNTPTARAYALIAWTGSKMIVWGGGKYNNILNFTGIQNGAIYNAQTKAWESMSSVNGPKVSTSWIDQPAGIWTGQSMLVPTTAMKYTPP